MLYLRWEAEYPDEWGAPGSWMWSRSETKEAVLRRLDRGGVPEDIQPQIAELILAALRRPYRRKDWAYACLVRHLDDPLFLHEVEMLASADDPAVRLRAQFVLHVATDREQRTTRTSWRRADSSNRRSAGCMRAYLATTYREEPTARANHHRPGAWTTCGGTRSCEEPGTVRGDRRTAREFGGPGGAGDHGNGAEHDQAGGYQPLSLGRGRHGTSLHPPAIRPAGHYTTAPRCTTYTQR